MEVHGPEGLPGRGRGGLPAAGADRPDGENLDPAPLQRRHRRIRYGKSPRGGTGQARRRREPADLSHRVGRRGALVSLPSAVRRVSRAAPFAARRGRGRRAASARQPVVRRARPAGRGRSPRQSLRRSRLRRAGHGTRRLVHLEHGLHQPDAASARPAAPGDAVRPPPAVHPRLPDLRLHRPTGEGAALARTDPPHRGGAQSRRIVEVRPGRCRHRHAAGRHEAGHRPARTDAQGAPG
ncbi:hypothetical protein D3C81_1372910 [compost metagenome]